MGCIPVTVTDHVHQPFEPEVDWARFSVPVREDDIAQLHHVLTGLRASPHTLAQMQVGPCGWTPACECTAPVWMALPALSSCQGLCCK